MTNETEIPLPSDGQGGEDGWERLERDVPVLEEIEASTSCQKSMGDPETGLYLKDPIDSWTLSPTRRWLARCDCCKVRRLWGDYRETYREGGWWWECERCLLASITRVAEKAQQTTEQHHNTIEIEGERRKTEEKVAGEEEARRQSRPDDIT